MLHRLSFGGFCCCFFVCFLSACWIILVFPECTRLLTWTTESLTCIYVIFLHAELCSYLIHDDDDDELMLNVLRCHLTY